jgi:hypothetical protein
VTTQPRGQRPCDLVAHAREILARYNRKVLMRLKSTGTCRRRTQS